MDELFLAQQLRELGSRAAVSPSARSTARNILGQAVSERRWSKGWRTFVLGSLVPVAAGMAGALVVLGWSAPTGSALHVVQNVREEVGAAFAGTTRMDALLSDAEERLDDARHGHDAAVALAEARAFLSAVSNMHPTPGSATAQRLERDLTQLAALASTEETPSPVSPPSPTTTTTPRSTPEAETPDAIQTQSWSSPGATESPDGGGTPSGDG